MNEVWFKLESRDKAKLIFETFDQITKGGKFPEGVRLIHGPFISNEDGHVIMIMEIQDHAKTLNALLEVMTGGIVAKRRLTPIASWGDGLAFFKSGA